MSCFVLFVLITLAASIGKKVHKKHPDWSYLVCFQHGAIILGAFIVIVVLFIWSASEITKEN